MGLLGRLGLWGLALSLGQAAAAAECAPDGPPERLSLSAGTLSTVASGLRVHFEGSSWDHHADDTFDHLAQLGFGLGEARDTQIISVLTPPEYRATLGHCWRLLELTDSRAEVEIAMERDESKVPPSCAEPSELPAFDSFFDAAQGASFQATLRYDPEVHEWRVTPTPTFLPHHATRLVWSNLAATELGRARAAEVRVELEFGASDIQKVPDRHQWRATHSATIRSVCRVE